MKRRGFIKSLGLTPLILLAIKKKSKVDVAMDEIVKGINPKENIESFTETFEYTMKGIPEQLAISTHATLERLAAEALR